MTLNTLRTELYEKSYRVVKVDEIFEVVRPGRPWHANQIFGYIAGPQGIVYELASAITPSS